MGENELLSLQPGGGRPSSEFLPYFNVQVDNEGVILGIGWTGEWASTFDRKQQDLLRLRSGLALTHLKLLPGEEIRTPLMLALFWQGEALHGHNMLRQLVLSIYRPFTDGKDVRTPICNGNWGATPAAIHLQNIKQIVAHDLPMDYYWIDAEWFGKGPWWKNTGNWEINRELYPDGFKPISDLLHASGRKFLLWFEPFRVCKGTPWYTEHANWLLAVPKEHASARTPPRTDPNWFLAESRHNAFERDDRLFNIADPDARAFLTDFISERIRECGIDCYRQDFNFAPVEFWRGADAPDRQGITEIRWVEGLYKFWDDLLSRHPGLLIDICASGGRQLDLEAMKRGLPLWRSDFPGHDTANQDQTYGLMFWLPLNSTSVGDIGQSSDYTVRSGMSSGLQYGLLSVGDAPQVSTDYSALPFARIKSVLEQQRTIEKYFYGDFYPLMDYSEQEDAWMAYQLDLDAGAEGLVVVLKRPASPITTALFPLHALDPAAGYEVVDLDSKKRWTKSGLSLTNTGLEVTLSSRPESLLLQYTRVRR
jgi:alpha-galactosidase